MINKHITTRSVTQIAPLTLFYGRFSSKEQANGDSEARQTRMAEKWAKEKGVQIDEVYWDKGVSAFEGKNTDRELGRLLANAEKKGVPSGSRLLVEQVDRLSRQTPMASLLLVNRIHQAGLTIVTLADGREFSPDENGQEAMLSIVVNAMNFGLSNQESEKKRVRVTAVWVEKWKNAHKKPATMTCPAWLKPNSDKTGFVVIQDRAKIVRRIYEEFAQGRGVFSIASGLRKDGIAPWGKRRVMKKDCEHLWRPSYVHKVLNTVTVTGALQPFRNVKENGKRVRYPVGDPVPDYYPRIIDDAQWLAVTKRWQKIAANEKAAHGARGRDGEITSLFSGLLMCGRNKCGVRVVRKDKRTDVDPMDEIAKAQQLPEGSARDIAINAAVHLAMSENSKVLAYSESSDAKLCGWKYDEIEALVLGQILTTKVADLWPENAARAELKELAARVATLEVDYESASKKMNALVDSIEAGLDLQDLRARLTTRSAEKEALALELAAAHREYSTLSSRERVMEDSITSIRRLFAARRLPEIRQVLQNHVREIVEKIEIFFEVNLNERISKAITASMAARGVNADTRDSMVEKSIRKKIAAREKKRVPDKWIDIHVKGGAIISTKGKPPGLWLQEEPLFTLLDMEDGVMLGWADYENASNARRISDADPDIKAAVANFRKRESLRAQKKNENSPEAE